MPTSTVEDYLKAILMRQHGGGVAMVSTGAIARDLGVAPGTVTAMMKTLAGSGLASYERYAGVRLTAAGERLALHVLRRHRLIELFLVRIMKMDWSEVHEEAEILEHAFTDRLIERIDALLGHPDVDPHGDPIPSAEGEVLQRDLVALVESPAGSVLEVARLTDQSPDFLRMMEREGMTPGCRMEVKDRSPAADKVIVRLVGGRQVSLGWRAAEKILVNVGGAAS
jgi:DtxR family Mn-dependent transcriptional regulator